MTGWYLGTLAFTLLVLGAGLFVALSHQLERYLDFTLRHRMVAIERAARRQVADSTGTSSALAGLREMRFVDQNVFLLALDGTPIAPVAVPAAVRDVALKAAVAGKYVSESWPADDGDGEGGVLVRAERFTVTDGQVVIAVASMDGSEWREQYTRLIAAFGGAALLALLLIAGGGSLLVRKSTAPIELSIEQMRRFMSDAAHELRTPVTVIRTGAEVALQQPRDGAEYTAALGGVAAESRRLGAILDDLLVLARADSGARPIESIPLFLDDVAADAANAARPLATAAGVSLEVDQFEEAETFGDATLTRQLVMILLDNAIKFTPTGGAVSLRVGMDGGTPTIVIADTGIGIAASDLPHIFERFFRVNRARRRDGDDTRSDQGAGLGLAIAQWIADAHRARIEVTSSVGTGTTVTVRFASTSESKARAGRSSDSVSDSSPSGSSSYS
ncbi:MAG TPA: ATP-binding protein [Gemmatimonadales bacterium]